MKVVLLGPFFPFRGGLASFNERLTQELIAAGHEVEVVTFKLQYPKLLFPGKTQFSDGVAPKGIKISEALNSINPFNWIKLGKKLKKMKPDLILTRYWIPFMAPSFSTVLKKVRKNNHTKVLCIVDNIEPHEKRMGDQLLNQMFVKAVDGFITMSENVLQDLKKYVSHDHLVLTPHPLFDNYGAGKSRTASLKNLKLNPEKKYILFFGFIRGYKGLDWLLEAYAQANLNEQVEVLVAGEFYDNKKKYTDLIESLGIESSVKLYDQFIGDDEVADFFCGADLVVQPYKSATQSGVTQVAYHFERPMLVTDVGGLSEVVKDGVAGYVVPPKVEAITAGIEDFFNGNKSLSFQEGLKKEKDRFSWAEFVRQIENLNQKVINE